MNNKFNTLYESLISETVLNEAKKPEDFREIVKTYEGFIDTMLDAPGLLTSKEKKTKSKLFKRVYKFISDTPEASDTTKNQYHYYMRQNGIDDIREFIELAFVKFSKHGLSNLGFSSWQIDNLSGKGYPLQLIRDLKTITNSKDPLYSAYNYWSKGKFNKANAKSALKARPESKLKDLIEPLSFAYIDFTEKFERVMIKTFNDNVNNDYTEQDLADLNITPEEGKSTLSGFVPSPTYHMNAHMDRSSNKFMKFGLAEVAPKEYKSLKAEWDKLNADAEKVIALANVIAKSARKLKSNFDLRLSTAI
jgi:hypothetical protein